MNDMRVRHFGIWQATVTGVVLAFGVTASAHTATNDAPKAAYLQYCSACHGSGGKGDGIVSGFMTPKPTDLTQLSKKSGGKFPHLKTLQAIDGTATVRAHGDADMPVWGEIFKVESPSSLHRQAEVRGKLMLILDFIETIQE